MPVDFDAIMKQISVSQNKANAANLKRYEELLTSLSTLSEQIGAQGTFGEAMALMETVGTAAQTRIQEQAAKARGATEQDLISRGLGGTTTRQAQLRAVGREEEQAIQASEQSLAQKKSGLLAQRAGAELDIGRMRAGAIEGRTDAGPDMSMFASLIQAAAAADKATPAGGKRTVTVAGGSPGPGIVTRHRAEQAASAAGAAAGAGGGGGLNMGGGGGLGSMFQPTGSGGIVYGTAFKGEAEQPTGLGRLAAAGGGTVMMGEQGSVTGGPPKPIVPEVDRSEGGTVEPASAAAGPEVPQQQQQQQGAKPAVVPKWATKWWRTAGGWSWSPKQKGG